MDSLIKAGTVCTIVAALLIGNVAHADTFQTKIGFFERVKIALNGHNVIYGKVTSTSGDSFEIDSKRGIWTINTNSETTLELKESDSIEIGDKIMIIGTASKNDMSLDASKVTRLEIYSEAKKDTREETEGLRAEVRSEIQDNRKEARSVIKDLIATGKAIFRFGTIETTNEAGLEMKARNGKNHTMETNTDTKVHGKTWLGAEKRNITSNHKVRVYGNANNSTIEAKRIHDLSL